MVNVRVFVSSPGDVALERVCAERVIERLKLEYSGRVDLEGFFWEHEPMRATASFNDPENIPLTKNFDIVICILWSRLGTMLSRKFIRPNGEPYPSGTAFEIETATEAYRQFHRPDIIVFRRTQEVPMPVNNPAEAERRSRQLTSLNQFIQDWFFDEDSAFKAAINEYEALGQFELKLERPLRRLILNRIEEDSEAEPAAPLALPITYHGENPFRGLEAYDFEDAPIFFGRSQAIEDVLNTMRKQAETGRTFTLVHGASGSGKSSLMRAGVIPMITHKSCPIEGVACWTVAAMEPGASGGDLLRDLEASLLAESAIPGMRRELSSPDALVKLLKENPEGSLSLIERGLQAAAQEVQSKEGLSGLPVTKLVLLVDQLEQIFSDDRRFPREERLAFARALATLARSGNVWVVATIRSDQLATLTEDLPELAELSQGGQCSLLAPTEKDMDLMIRLPARAAGVLFEEDPATKEKLDSRLLRDARDAPDGLPLLSFVLRELYARREKVGGYRMMTHASLDELGGLEGAVKSRAETIFGEFEAANPDVADPLVQLARKLVTLGRGKEPVALRRLAPISSFGEEVKPLVDALVEGRLLTKKAGEDDEVGVVHVTHEALFRKWEGLQEAIEANRDFLRLRARAATAATDWVERQRSRDLLWNRGVSLADARTLKADPEDLDAIEREFVEVSDKSGRSRRRTRIGMAAAVLLALGGVVWWKLSDDAGRDQRAREVAARQAEFEDLESQLGFAVAALKDSLWPDAGAAGPKSGTAYPAEFPAASVAEIVRRLLKREPKHREAFAASVLATIHDDSGLLSPEEKEAAVRAQFEQWNSFNLPKNEILNLQGQLQWELGNRADAVDSWRSYLKTPDLDDVTRRRLLTLVTSHYLASEQWEDLERIISQDWAWEDNAVAKIRRAKARLELFKLDLAKQDYDEARQVIPDDELVFAVGPPLERLLRYRDAIAAATDDIDMPGNQGRPEPWLERARLMMVVGRYPDAANDLDEAAKRIRGKSTLIEFLRAIVQIRSGKELPQDNPVIAQWDHRKPDDQFEEWIGQKWPSLQNLFRHDIAMIADPNSTQNLVERSQGWQEFFQSNLGIADADAAIAIDPAHYGAHFWRGVHCLNQRRYNDVLKEAETLQQIRPDWQGAYQIRAQAQFGLGNAEAAVGSITQAIERAELYFLYEMRASYLRRLGRNKEAELDDQAAFRLKQ